jgi:Icc-related predicted phosphoesterase
VPVKIGGREAVRTGSRLAFTAKDADGNFTLGVLGPINEDSGANLMALDRYVKFFQQHKVDGIVVTGDVGETAKGIERVLRILAKPQVPVFVVVGNSECASDYAEGVAAAQKDFPNLVNLNDLREVTFPEATLVSLPGHHDANYLHCAKGCLYTPGNVDEVIQIAKEAKSPVILVSHGPPHGEGTQALDFTPNSGGNVGNLDIQRGIHDGKISFGFFSNIKEAGSRATDASGSTVIPQNTPVKALFLNPGPASTDAWKMNDGKTSHGFAAVFTLNAKGASWALFRNTELTKAEKKKAKALDPKPDEKASKSAE